MHVRFFTILIITVFSTSIIFTSVIFAADLSAPLIDLPRVKPPKSNNTAITIKAIVDDDIAVGSVKLFYRIIGKNTGFSSIRLKPSKNNPKFYTTELPLEINETAGIEFYVEARDTANNITQEPFPTSPRKLYLQPQPPKKTKAASNNRLFTQGLYGGAGVYYGIFTIDDPQGDTGTSYTPSAAAFIGYAPNRLWRGMANLNYQNFSLPYSTTNIGQDVNALRLDLLIQRAFLIFKHTSWVGVGIGIENNKITNRGTELNDRFADKFDDRNETNYGFVIDFGYEIVPIKNSTLGVNAKLYQTLDNGVNAFLVGLFFSFD